jgi:hypothetical protein
MVTDDQESSIKIQERCCGLETILESIELIVDIDAQSLKGLGSRM